ncbi:MAG: mucoidy inhibitor MuiA family protein [Myxococcota bacterium]
MNMLIPVTLLLTSAPATTVIERVVVFSDRAEVTRRGTASCKNGRAELEITGLPMSLDARTIQAQSRSGAKLLGISTRVESVDPEEVDQRRAVVLKALTEAQDKLRVLDSKMATNVEESTQSSSFDAYLTNLVQEDLRSGKPNPDAWKKAAALFGDQRLGARKRNIELGVERRKLERELIRLNTRLAAFQQSESDELRAVNAAVECQGAGTQEIDVSYTVPGATWHPEYDLRFSPDGEGKTGKGKVELMVSAIVQQASGEDWEKASISLSTAKPKLGGEAPTPAPIVVDGYKAGEEKVLVQGTEDRSGLSAGDDNATRQGPVAADLEDGGRAFLLSFPGRATIQSDGRPYWLPVDEIATRGEVKLVALPKLKTFVFHALSLQNPARYPLVSGVVHAHRKGAYVGDASIPYVAPGEPIEISLGIDDAIKVEKKDVKEMDNSPGFLSSTRKLEREYRIKVKNQSQSAERVEIRENIPVSKDEELKVELLKNKTTAGHRFDPKRGFITFEVDVPRGAERSVDLSYIIHIPESWKMQ